jgi:hypothetical protein
MPVCAKSLQGKAVKGMNLMSEDGLCMLIVIFLAAGMVFPACAGPADVSVTGVRLDPPVLMRGDLGTITVSVINAGPDSVPVSRAVIYSNTIRPQEDPYPVVGELGPGVSRDFVFPVLADAPDGMYFPLFTLDFRDDGSLRYAVPVQVESTELALAVMQKPDSYTGERTANVTLSVSNPRSSAVSGVSITPEGDGFSASPSSAFIGALQPDGSAPVSFEITPHNATTLSFRLEYRNGVNSHTVLLELPVEFSEGKRRAEPILSNTAVIPEGGVFRVTGDVTNAGLEVARSVIVRPGEGLEPADPYREYVVGSLDPDDFSSFEVTFRAPAGVDEAPLTIEYRDEDGNVFSTTSPVGLENLTAAQTQSSLPPAGIAAGAVAAIAVIGAVLYFWRRR